MSGARRTILITGATGGIGLALAKKLAFRHEVLAVGRRPEGDVEDVLLSTVKYICARLEEPEVAAQTIVDSLVEQNIERLDNCVLNAGVGFVTENGLDTPETIDQTLNVNLTASMMLAYALYPYLSKARGTLTLVGSVAHRGQSLFPAYAASKAGLHGFARALRSEWRGKVTVQVVHPGPTRTDMHEKAGYDPGWMRDVFLKPEDVASMMAFAMASGRSPQTLSFARYLTGGAAIGRRL